MPLEIREVVIKANLVNPESSRKGELSEQDLAKLEKRIVKACLEQLGNPRRRSTKLDR